jgi:DNA invertase Pin-like site-specific DNA recombinase
MNLGYARVSSISQDYETQVAALKIAGCNRTYAEKMSGKNASNRPELQKLLSAVRPGDKVVVTKLYRLGRDIVDISTIVRELSNQGAGLVVLDQGLDTSSTWGCKFLELLAWVGSVELELRNERVRAGVARAKAAGRYKGRKRKLSPERALELRAKGMTLAEIGAEVGVSKQAVAKALKATVSG